MPFPSPVRPTVSRKSQCADPDRERDAPRRFERSCIRVFNHDAIARDGREVQGPAGKAAYLRQRNLKARLAKRRNFGGVSIGVGRRCRDVWQIRRRAERDTEDGLSGTIGRNLQRSEEVLGLPGAAGRIAGAGVNFHIESRVGQASSEPTLERSIGRCDDNWEILEVIRPLTRLRGIIGDAVVPEVDGLADRDDPRRQVAANASQCGVVMVGCLVVSRRPLALVERIIGHQARCRWHLPVQTCLAQLQPPSALHSKW